MYNFDLFSRVNNDIDKYKNKEKELGQVFTPLWIVEMMLDKINYSKKYNILDKKILEPSCGEGAFLVEIVKIYIEKSIEENISLEEIKYNLENNIYGVEIDISCFKKCIENLNLIAKSFALDNVKWKISNSDYLLFKFEEKFDYIIGNPPYVRVHNLDEETKIFLKNNYSFCNKGTTDLYYAFYEKALAEINNIDGLVSFITPNSFMTNATGNKLRDYIIDRKFLKSLINFGEYQIFDNASTYNAIMLLSATKSEDFDYFEFTDKINFVNKIKSNIFYKKNWNFSN